MLQMLAIALSRLKVYSFYVSPGNSRREEKQCKVGQYCYMLSGLNILILLLIPRYQREMKQKVRCTIYFPPTDLFKKSRSHFG